VAFEPSLIISPIFSGFGARLDLLEKGVLLPPTEPIDVTLQLARNLIGTDFGAKGPRYTPTKTPLNTELPAGARYLNPGTITTDNTAVLFDGWDLTGYSFYLTQGQTTLIDTIVARANAFVVDRRGSAFFTAKWSDLDGMKSPFESTMIVSRSAQGGMDISDSKIHGAGADHISVSSNTAIQRSWVYDGWNSTNPILHAEPIQLLTASNGYANLVFKDNLLDSGYKDTASIIRLVTEKSDAKLDNVLIQGNVMLRNASREDVPIAIGAKVGAGPVSNVRILDNWLRYGTPKPLYPYAVPGGTALWKNNRLADTGSFIDTPSGWSS